MFFHGNLASPNLNSPEKKSVERMFKSVESTRSRRSRQSRNVSSFSEESTESVMPAKTTLNVIVDVHNENSKLDRRQQDDTSNLAIELLGSNKTVKRSSERSIEDCKAPSRASEGLWNRSINRTKDRRNKESRDDQIVDLIEEFETPKKSSESLDEKPHRRKQWSTGNASEVHDSKGRTRRKRWSKDTSVIRLPETSDDPESPLIDNRDPPVPMPRSNMQRNALSFDNPVFTSENDDEVLRIETDHNRESTKIEIRRMNDHASVRDIEDAGASNGSWRKNRRKVASERFVDSDDRSSKISRSSESKENIGKIDSSTSLGEVTDVQSNSITSEGPSSTSEKVFQGSLRKRGRSLFKEKSPGGKNEVNSSVKDLSFTFETDARTRKKKKRKRKQKHGQQNMNETKEKEEMKHISVTIHRADVLEADYMNIKRPMVKVHIVETRTGSYLMNKTENGESNNGFLQPMITGKFDFKENRSMIPVWEEELIFEYDFNAITRREDSNQVVIFFEVIDLLSFAEASVNYDRIGNEGCWNKIAWAFLKPIGINNTLHTDKKVRLQLYRPRQSFKRYAKHKCEVHSWWQSNNRDKYPSSLLVTITSVPPRKTESVIYQQLPLDDLLDDTRNISQRPSTRTSESIGLPKWARLAAQSCKIPNEIMFETEVSENGCFYVAFSNDGKYLACAHSEEYNYPIIVYEAESGKIHVRFLGHKAFVYSLNWSSDDHYLLSASADQTARMWDVRNQIIQHVEMLPHPSYVYCAKYGPEKEMIVATGCYDQVARIWANDRKSKKRELNQELEGHEGFVNSIVFQKSGNLITADSVGSIIIWTAHRNNRMPSKREWRISRKIKIREIEGVIINTIILHPLESRLLVHSRDNDLRLVDLATGVILQKYKQLNNQRIQLKACISPCGGLVLCGGEDSVLNVWNLETGKHQAKYTSNEESSVKIIVSCVDYHPYDHILAFSTFGGPTSVRILRFNKNAIDEDIGLKLTEDNSQIRGNEVILNVFDRPLLQRSKFSNDTVVRKQVPSPCHSIDHTTLQIENGDDREQLWTKLRRLREIERNWKKKSMDRLYCIIQKIDSMLSKTSMSPDDFVEAKSIHKGVEANALRVLEEGNLEKRIEKFHETELFSVNECNSLVESSSVSNNVHMCNVKEEHFREWKTKKRHRPIVKERPKSAKELVIDKLVDQCRFSKTLSDSAAGSTRVHSDLFQDYARFAVHVRNQDHSRNSTALFEKMNTSVTSHVSSPNSSDSAGTYTIKIHSDKNVNDIKIEKINYIHEDDSSQISDATFIIEH